jgi:hypothetical protein
VSDECVAKPPVYPVHSTTACWKCGAQQPVAAILAVNVEGAGGEVCIFSGVTRLPPDLLAYVRKRRPTYRLSYSRTAGMKYFANTCGSCGALFGDFYLHDEPGGAFFPDSEEDAARMRVEEIPLRSEIRIAGSPGVGTGDMIIQHARRTGPGECA